MNKEREKVANIREGHRRSAKALGPQTGGFVRGKSRRPKEQRWEAGRLATPWGLGRSTCGTHLVGGNGGLA